MFIRRRATLLGISLRNKSSTNCEYKRYDGTNHERSNDANSKSCYDMAKDLNPDVAHIFKLQ
jgi:hypothetical protein